MPSTSTVALGNMPFPGTDNKFCFKLSIDSVVMAPEFFLASFGYFQRKATFSFICLRNARDELMNLSLLSKEMPSMGDHGINKGSLLTFSG